jgi:hypothetical protein
LIHTFSWFGLENSLDNPSYQNETENLNNPISIKDIELVFKIFPSKRTSGPDVITGKFHRIFDEKIIITFYNIIFFLKLEQGTIPAHSRRPSQIKQGLSEALN